MTFIASVASKEGVAIIADSLMTSSIDLLESSEFLNYIETRKKANKTVVLDPDEVTGLFKLKPMHTKNYEDKLYRYDKYTAITTAGSALINGKRIKKLVQDAITNLKPEESTLGIYDKIYELKNFIEAEVKKAIKHTPYISPTVFMVIHYDTENNKTLVYKIYINKENLPDLKSPNAKLVEITQEEDNFPVVCDGHNKVSERILFGPIPKIYQYLGQMARKMLSDFKIDPNSVKDDYLETFLDSILKEDKYSDDIKIHKLGELSLQQAVDLACLLMRIEMDIEKYTEIVPTVGGVIKVAIINQDGFKYIMGNDIMVHENFYQH